MSRGGPKANKRRANARKRALDALISPQTQEDLKGLKISAGQLNEHITRNSNADAAIDKKGRAQAKGRKAKSKNETCVKTETQEEREELVVGSGEGEEQQQELGEEEHRGGLMDEDIKEDEAAFGAGDVKPEDIKAEETMDLL